MKHTASYSWSAGCFDFFGGPLARAGWTYFKPILTIQIMIWSLFLDKTLVDMDAKLLGMINLILICEGLINHTVHWIQAIRFCVRKKVDFLVFFSFLFNIQSWIRPLKCLSCCISVEFCFFEFTPLVKYRDFACTAALRPDILLSTVEV